MGVVSPFMYHLSLYLKYYVIIGCLAATSPRNLGKFCASFRR